MIEIQEVMIGPPPEDPQMIRTQGAVTDHQLERQMINMPEVETDLQLMIMAPEAGTDLQLDLHPIVRIPETGTDLQLDLRPIIGTPEAETDPQLDLLMTETQEVEIDLQYESQATEESAIDLRLEQRVILAGLDLGWKKVKLKREPLPRDQNFRLLNWMVVAPIVECRPISRSGHRWTEQEA